MAECARCGKCCQLIGWNPETGQRPWEEVETLALGGHPDAMFMVAHWRYCWGTGYYWCDCFDFETHLCTVHQQKPKVCSDYPYYGRDALPSKLHDGCAFAGPEGKSIEIYEQSPVIQGVLEPTEPTLDLSTAGSHWRP